MNYYGYMPITTDPVLLNLDGCKDWGGLHQRIRKAFGFPDYYGENWDAMWDCLTDVFLQPVQKPPPHGKTQGSTRASSKKIPLGISSPISMAKADAGIRGTSCVFS